MRPLMKTKSDIDLESLKKFVRTKIIPGNKQRDDEATFPIDLFQELHSLGFITAFLPEPYGGSELSTTDLISVARELAYGSSGITTSFIANMLALVPVFQFGSDELRRKIASQSLAKLSLSSFCFTEPEAGSDVLRIKTEAKRVPGGYQLSGQKTFITNANYADHYVIVARTGDSTNPKKALSLFYVPAGTKGLSIGKPIQKMGHRDSNTSEVFLDKVFVPDEHRIGEEGDGLKIAIFSLTRSRTLFAASAVGLCDRACDLTTRFLAERVHFGKPLSDQPAIRNLLAQLKTEAQAAWLLACSAASEWDQGSYQLTPSSMAKMYSGQVAVRFASGALELMGGWGYTCEYEIERIYRDAKLYEIIEGPTFVQQVIIAKEMFSQLESESRSKLKAA